MARNRLEIAPAVRLERGLGDTDEPTAQSQCRAQLLLRLALSDCADLSVE